MSEFLSAGSETDVLAGRCGEGFEGPDVAVGPGRHPDAGVTPTALRGRESRWRSQARRGNPM